jgi:hypothetical protein
MFRLVLAAVFALLFVPGLVAAQDAPRGRGGPDVDRILERMEQRLEDMKGPLGLSQQQQTRIRQALRQGANQARRVLREHPERGPERREALRQVRWDTSDRVHAILTCEQREQLRRLRREQRSERRQHHRQRRAGAMHRSPSDGGI